MQGDGYQGSLHLVVSERTRVALAAHSLGPECTRLRADFVRIDATGHVVNVFSTASLVPATRMIPISISVVITVVVGLLTAVRWLLRPLGLVWGLACS